jgi:threonine dehydrogenase-like Zn-dependent dehydrogenase
MNVRAYWVESPGQGSIRSVDLAAPSVDEVLVRTLFSGISRGTESLVYRGRVPSNQHEAMCCPHQEGSFSFPIKYGYICVGVVESDGDLKGQPVFCLHPHQTHFVVPRSAVTPLPEGLDPAMAVLTANLETAVNGVWDADPQPGERISVVGAGVVGALVAWRLRTSFGLDVELVDINPDRAVLARALGLDFRVPAEATAERDLIVHASGSEAGLLQALNMAAPEGRIIEMSWFGDRPVQLPLGEAFHSRRLTLRCSQVGQIPPRLRQEWDYGRRLELVLGLLRDHPELGCLIDGESHFEELPKTMEKLVDGGGVLCHRIQYLEDSVCFV